MISKCQPTMIEGRRTILSILNLISINIEYRYGYCDLKFLINPSKSNICHIHGRMVIDLEVVHAVE